MTTGLQALQQLIDQKRAEARRLCLERGLPVDLHQDPEKRKELQRNIQRLIQPEPTQPNLAEISEKIEDLPDHLGWHNETITRQIRARSAKPGTKGSSQPLLSVPLFDEPEPEAKAEPQTIKIYPR